MCDPSSRNLPEVSFELCLSVKTCFYNKQNDRIIGIPSSLLLFFKKVRDPFEITPFPAQDALSFPRHRQSQRAYHGHSHDKSSTKLW